MQDYHSSISVNISPKEVFDKITRVSEWWATNFEGNSQKLHDVFTVRFKNGDMYTLKVIESIPDKKIVWEVVDSHQGWVENETEWTGTKIVWEITSQNDGTQIDMIHKGLTPKLECNDKCKQGWDYLLHKSLSKLLTENKGLPV